MPSSLESVPITSPGTLDNACDLASHAEGFASNGFSCRSLRGRLAQVCTL